MKALTILLQAEQIVDKSREVMGIGESANVTTIGVMAIFCVVMGAIVIALWRRDISREKESKLSEKETLTTLMSVSSIMADINNTSEGNSVKISQNRDLVNQANNKLDILISKLK